MKLVMFFCFFTRLLDYYRFYFMIILVIVGKIELVGFLEDRFDQLDKREIELLGELEKFKKQVKRLKDEKIENRQRMEEYE